MAILEVNNIEKHFGSTKVLKDVSFSLEQGNALAIIGSSGSGKTTLLRCLNFLEKPDHGTIIVNGETLFDGSVPYKRNEKELRRKRLHFGMVFQSFNLVGYVSGKCHLMGDNPKEERTKQFLTRYAQG